MENNEMKKLNDQELEDVSGGTGGKRGSISTGGIYGKKGSVHSGSQNFFGTKTFECTCGNMVMVDVNANTDITNPAINTVKCGNCGKVLGNLTDSI